MRIDVYIKLLEKIEEEHGNLPVCVSDGKSDIIWTALPPRPVKGVLYGEGDIIAISPER